MQICLVILSTFIETHEVCRNKLHDQTMASLYCLSSHHPKNLHSQPQFSFYGNLIRDYSWYTLACGFIQYPIRLQPVDSHAAHPCLDIVSNVSGRLAILDTQSAINLQNCVFLLFYGADILQQMHSFLFTLWGMKVRIDMDSGTWSSS